MCFCRRPYSGNWIHRIQKWSFLIFFTFLKSSIFSFESVFQFWDAEKITSPFCPKLIIYYSSIKQEICQKSIQNIPSQKLTACLSVAINLRTNIWSRICRAGHPLLLVTESTLLSWAIKLYLLQVTVLMWLCSPSQFFQREMEQPLSSTQHQRQALILKSLSNVVTWVVYILQSFHFCCSITIATPQQWSRHWSATSKIGRKRNIIQMCKRESSAEA